MRVADGKQEINLEWPNYPYYNTVLESYYFCVFQLFVIVTCGCFLSDSYIKYKLGKVCT